MLFRSRLDIETDYNGLGKIQYVLAQKEIPVLETEYTEQVVIHAVIPADKKNELEKAVTEGTSGAAKLIWGNIAEFAVIDGKAEIFDVNET